MPSSRDDAEYFYSLAAEARELMRHSKDDRIVNEALTVIVEAYRALARRAERAKESAKASLSLWLLCACQWLPDLAEAAASV